MGSVLRQGGRAIGGLAARQQAGFRATVMGGVMQRRSIQFSSDDRSPGLSLPDYEVRKYDRQKGLSRSMDTEAEQACRMAEKQLGIDNLELKPWKEWTPAANQVLLWRVTNYVIIHARERVETKLTRKVQCIFRPTDLKLSEKATSNLIKICGQRYNPNKKIITMTSDTLTTQAENKIRLECMVAQLIYYSKIHAGEAVPGGQAEQGEGKEGKAEQGEGNEALSST